ITDDESIYRKVSQLCDHGASKTDLQRHHEKGGSLLPDFTMRGYNYRMTDMQGALGVCQMRKAEKIMAGRRNIASQYQEALQHSGLELPIVPDGFTHGYQSYVCLFSLEMAHNDLTMQRIDSLNIK